jgi:hypothetical protein
VKERGVKRIVLVDINRIEHRGGLFVDDKLQLPRVAYYLRSLHDLESNHGTVVAEVSNDSGPDLITFFDACVA